MTMSSPIKASKEIELELSLKTGFLSLKECGLIEVPEKIYSMTHLISIDLSGNNIMRLSKRISNLKDLRVLNLSDNAIENLPNELGLISCLEDLNISSNCLSAIPEDIKKLKNLKQISINNNPLKTFPEFIGEIKSIKHLLANNIEINKFPVEVTQLTNLLSLNLANNRITNIPREFVKLESLNVFDVKGNNLVRPPIEILSRGPRAIINYLHEFDEQESLKIREAKLLIVGQGAVGKTCLMNRLISNNYSDESSSTEGIEIKNWKIDAGDGRPFTLNVWDFGGQEIYHATHQFFLTKRSLYLFVWDARREENILSFDYWLNVIKLLSDSSPTIIVMNKCDERVKMIDEESLKQKFNNILSFHRVSSKTGEGILELIKDIKRRIVALEHVGDILPKTWTDIRKHLELLDKNYISYRKYIQICKIYGMASDKARFLSQYYHDLGTFLHFQDHPILKQIIFLKPEWATNAVYRLVDSKDVIDSYGKFSYSQLTEIWRDYPEERHIHLIELMKRFELCFELPATQNYIVPELLNTKKPKFGWNEDSTAKFIYSYEFMPVGILTRFIARNHDMIANDIYWKNGVLLKREGGRALIISEPLNRRIIVQIHGDEPAVLLSIIRREFDIIHATLNNPHTKCYVPCVCKECKISKNPYMHEFDYLRRAKSREKRTVECKNTLDEVSINEILGAYINEKKKQDDITNIYYVGQFINIGEVAIKGECAADVVDKIGISKKDYTDLIDSIRKIGNDKASNLKELVTSKSENYDINSWSQRVKSFAKNNGIPIIQNISASGLYDLMRYMFL